MSLMPLGTRSLPQIQRLARSGRGNQRAGVNHPSQPLTVRRVICSAAFRVHSDLEFVLWTLDLGPWTNSDEHFGHRR
jgi:hypothetical protein